MLKFFSYPKKFHSSLRWTNLLSSSWARITREGLESLNSFCLRGRGGSLAKLKKWYFDEDDDANDGLLYLMSKQSLSCVSTWNNTQLSCFSFHQHHHHDDHHHHEQYHHHYHQSKLFKITITSGDSPPLSLSLPPCHLLHMCMYVNNKYSYLYCVYVICIVYCGLFFRSIITIQFCQHYNHCPCDPHHHALTLHVFVYLYLWICVFVYLYLYLYLCICVFVYLYLCIGVFVYLCRHVSVFVYLGPSLLGACLQCLVL